MSFYRIIALVTLTLVFSGASSAESNQELTTRYVNPGPFEVRTLLGEWTDTSRDQRQVPFKVYFPLNRLDKTPIIIWSHGAGGSREGGRYLGEHLASHGFASFHLQHPGTDASQRKGDGVGALLTRISNPRLVMLRFGDPGFAVKEIKSLAANGYANGMLDASRMGISGHSMGAMSGLVAAGQQNGRIGQRFAVKELMGAFVMSPAPRGGDAVSMFREMLMPVFHLTGTKDESPLKDFEPAARKIPFQATTNVDQYLLILDEAVHATFSGRPIANDPFLDDHHDRIRMAATAFWKMQLEDDRLAETWLKEGGFAAELAKQDTFTFKSGQ